jgi:anthranilate/para-aminobenzoate synthase component II
VVSLLEGRVSRNGPHQKRSKVSGNRLQRPHSVPRPRASSTQQGSVFDFQKLNPTVIHETYHTLVFKLKWKPEEAAGALSELLDDPAIMFLNQTKETTWAGVQLARQYSLGGRDALILASFLNPAVPEMVTFDRTLIQLRKVEHGARSLRIRPA